MANNRGLGKGFDSLIPQGFDTTILVDETERVLKLAVELLEPNPDQPRTVFDGTALSELAVSIRRYGIIQPLVVSPNGNKYYIIAGERRWRAAQQAGLKAVPALVRTTKELERLELALIENVQRVDLSPLEQAKSIERLHQQFNMTYNQIGERLGKAGTTVTNIGRLLQLPPEASKALAAQLIVEGHARQILALKGQPDKQIELLDSILKYGWTVRQAERYVTSQKEGVENKEEVKQRIHGETPATKALGERLGTTVQVRRMAHGGRLEITFKTDEQLEILLKSLGD
ncbi:MAG: ParB/RepB/Spo0J family partition protein [Candidatus Saccharimonadales bacterium]